MTYTDLTHLGVGTNDWMKVLEFYKDDLAILDQRLLEITKKNTGKDAAIGIEHFLNQFDIQSHNISGLKHRIKGYNKQVALDVQQHANYVNSEVIKNQSAISEDLKRFENTLKELRHEFNAFLSKWM